MLRSNDTNSSYTSTDLFQFPLMSVSKYSHKLHCYPGSHPNHVIELSKPRNRTPNQTNLYCDILKLLPSTLQFEHY